MRHNLHALLGRQLSTFSNHCQGYAFQSTFTSDACMLDSLSTFFDHRTICQAHQHFSGVYAPAMHTGVLLNVWEQYKEGIEYRMQAQK